MLGLNGLAKKKMDEAIGEEASFKKEGWELLLKTGMKVEDADMEEYLALVKAYVQDHRKERKDGRALWCGVVVSGVARCGAVWMRCDAVRCGGGVANGSGERRSIARPITTTPLSPSSSQVLPASRR